MLLTTFCVNMLILPFHGLVLVDAHAHIDTQSANGDMLSAAQHTLETYPVTHVVCTPALRHHIYYVYPIQLP